MYAARIIILLQVLFYSNRIWLAFFRNMAFSLWSCCQRIRYRDYRRAWVFGDAV